jgi:hypothetical protein
MAVDTKFEKRRRWANRSWLATCQSLPILQEGHVISNSNLFCKDQGLSVLRYHTEVTHFRGLSFGHFRGVSTIHFDQKVPNLGVYGGNKSDLAKFAKVLPVLDKFGDSVQYISVVWPQISGKGIIPQVVMAQIFGGPGMRAPNGYALVLKQGWQGWVTRVTKPG